MVCPLLLKEPINRPNIRPQPHLYRLDLDVFDCPVAGEVHMQIVMWLLNSGTFLQVMPGTEQLNILDLQRCAALGIRQDVVEVQFVG